MNAFAAGFTRRPAAAGALATRPKVRCQGWSRDPGFAPPNAIGLTGAIEYTVGS